jgi:Flp pilus assembly protein TadG
MRITIARRGASSGVQDRVSIRDVGGASRFDARVENGQAAVEFAVALPLIVVVMLTIVQVGVSVRNEVAVELAAREGARAAAVSADPVGAAAGAARRAVDLPIEVSTAAGAGRVAVTVTYVDPTDIAIIGAAIGPITHRATATMALEPP